MKAATFFLFIICGISAEQEQQEVKARPGQNVSLPCPGPEDASIIVFFWKRSDLPDGYLLFYRENRFHEHYQHAAFRGRVELTPSPMRDGDFSMVLQNISAEDEGTYDCLVKTRNPGGDSSEWRRSILLTVSGTANTEGQRSEKHSLNLFLLRR
ncbi:PREDICTED: ICOS ligand-like [Cyprinodon variegatus]|uniref:ICOS ligand-like n=1 Tax=Cyprinodon variegatus TaxID=28743 RepID=UPI00074288B8|nr:PREDICTED: ICOS ligand-like [Cyprinodon variegatus]